VSPDRATGLVQSILVRLKNQAREQDRPFAELLQLYAVERFLHRLGRSPLRDRFILKGALLLRYWLGAETRPTRDIDLLGPADLGEEGLRELLGDLLRLDVEDDGIEFDIDSITVRPIRLESAVLGLRGKFDAHLARTKLRYQVDVGLGDVVFPPTVELVPGGLLGLPMATVRAYTPYTMVAEKLEAIVVLGDANSRTKDYYDLFYVPRALAFDGPTLVESIRRTFARRATRIPTAPLDGLADAFASQPLHAGRWRGFLTKNRLQVQESDFADVVASIRSFAQPVLDAARDARPFRQHWPKGGPWRDGEEPDGRSDL
jgi:hypothetical protein